MRDRDHTADDLGEQVLDRYLAGSGTDAEREAVERWLAADRTGERAQWLAALATASVVEGREAQIWDHRAIWTGVMQRTRVQTLSTPRTIPAQRHWAKPTGLWRALGALAAAIITAGVLSVGWRAIERPAVLDETYATVAGQHLRVRLADGTEVTLGPVSRLRVPGAFASGARRVVLEGEGYFAVVHNANHPFEVYTGGLVTRDIGTQFDARAYPEDGEVRIAVAEGEVAVGRDGCKGLPCQTNLRAGDVATMESGEASVAVAHGVLVPNMAAWIQGRLVFQQTPLAQVVREISRTFDLTITVADSNLATYRITGSFANESADEILHDLVGIMGAQYQRTGRSIVIERAKRVMPRPAKATVMPLTTVQADGVRE